MKDVVIYIGQSGICIGIFFLIYRIFLRSATFFRFNRAFLLTGLIASFIIPFIHFSYDIILPISATSFTESSRTSTATETNKIDIWSLLFSVYIIGIIIQLVRNLISYKKVFKLIKSGISIQKERYKIIDSPQIKSPFTIFNNIAINTMNMTEIEKYLIIKHETTHISQKHWIDLLCSECALLLQWFNPIMWFYVSSQKENHEFLADRAVINTGVSPAVYQAALINQRFQGPVFSFSNSFNYPNQLNRLCMIKKAKTSPWRRVAILALIPSFGLFFWASATPRYIFKSIEDDSNNTSITPTKDSIQVIEFRIENTDPNKGVYFTDYGESSIAEIKELDSNNIESISTLKNKSATEVSSEKGKNDVIIVKIKEQALSTPKDDDFKLSNIEINTPLVFIEGKEVNNKILQAIDPNTIERVEVFKENKAIELYGERAKEGVILVTLKDK